MSDNIAAGTDSPLPAIEKGIPIPPRYSGERRWASLINKMEPGDSFLVPHGEDRQAIMMAAKRAGFLVLTRKDEFGNGWRIWRICKRKRTDI